MKPAAIFTIVFATCILSCRFMNQEHVKGNGTASTQTRSVGSFHSISAMGSMAVVVAEGPTPDLKIEADQNLLEYVETRNNGGTIEIYTREGYNLDPKSGITIYATAPNFQGIKVSGSGKINSTGKVTGTSELNTEINGSGDINIEADAPKITTQISGSGSARIKGTTKDFEAHISGSGDVYCYDLLSENTEIDIAGGGNAEVYASKTLDVDIAGSGDVRYRGNPSIKQNISGSGEIKKAD